MAKKPIASPMPDYDYANADAIREDLRCLICHDPLINPVEHPGEPPRECGNMFCKQCLEGWRKTSNKCPMCNESPMKGVRPVTLRKVLSELSSLPVVCATCRGNVERGQHAQHFARCPISALRRRCSFKTYVYCQPVLMDVWTRMTSLVDLPPQLWQNI